MVINMKKLLIILALLLIPSVMAQDNEILEVVIIEPEDLLLINTSDIILSAEMNKQGNMSHKLDDNNFTLECVNCFNFTIELENLTNGMHQIFVKGETVNETVNTSLFFLINTTLPSDNMSEPPDAGDGTNMSDGNDTNVSDGEINKLPRFSLGFNKLPKRFDRGELSPEELTGMILNNKLNPGIINRLAKTGKLSQENKDAIINNQFLPPGILNKLLGLIGFARNDNLEEFVENSNLTDSQLSTLIERNKIPKKTAVKLIEEYEQSLAQQVTS